MAIDPELLKQLIESFSTELNEHTQAITNGLLKLEETGLSQADRDKIIEVIFRSAHNIKGTARSLGINEVGEIAHRIESLFSAIQKNDIVITAMIIDICLEAVDKMRIAFESFKNKKALPFDLNEFINNLEKGQGKSSAKAKPKKEKLTAITTDYDSVRVPVAKIDKISSLLEEFQVNRIAIDDYYAKLTQLTGQINEFSNVWKQILNSVKNNPLYQSGNDYFIEINKVTKAMHKNMRARINDLSILSHALQEEVTTLRMIPVGNLLCTFPRYIRDLSRELNKEVELTTHGEEIKIDKVVLEGLKDPLIHLLRNAIDHGIENKSDRKSKGKPEVGHITIDIKEENGQMVISISDDGAGMNAAKIAEAAKKQNIISSQEIDELNESQLLELVFLPGFTTSEIITDVSGRGVGLDVVKSNIEDLKGKVTLSSFPGKGTTINLVVPLTISSERGLLIKSSNQLFVIPTTSVERVLLMTTNEIVDVQGGQAINLNNYTIPVRILSDILRLEKKSYSEDKLPIVVIKKGHHAVAFIIDEVVGEREVVLKPLHSPLDKIPCVSGGTLLENNQVVVVLEAGDLIQAALKQVKGNRVTIQETAEKIAEKPHILVVDDSITTRTLEKNVLESRNYQVTVAVNGKEAWDILQKQKFSLLITDVMMPIMDGFTLTEHVKRSDTLRNIPVIIVTSLGSDSEKKRGIEVGADAYIVKNEFESGALLNIVSQLL